jgi:hypothetical protein
MGDSILDDISGTIDNLIETSELSDETKILLNNLGLVPHTRSIRISSEYLDSDYIISAPDNWQNGLNLWQLLAGFDAFFKSYMRKYNVDDIAELFGSHIYWEGLYYEGMGDDNIPIYHLSLGS